MSYLLYKKDFSNAFSGCTLSSKLIVTHIGNCLRIYDSDFDLLAEKTFTDEVLQVSVVECLLKDVVNADDFHFFCDRIGANGDCLDNGSSDKKHEIENETCEKIADFHADKQVNKNNLNLSFNSGCNINFSCTLNTNCESFFNTPNYLQNEVCNANKAPENCVSDDFLCENKQKKLF
ncbi:hypothetical protein EDEG_02866 [Edhazardia aedis USNM 41457]|uniref:Uncharacterized protein n=1 Tax=Edhazardia aedis (strain USNM 41457) TaxID=1003232 RepID=J9DJF3_EDHAE|nr:hypothetical protein EDEG_02866 [Edhazardia aedis USNM 41457]|eukprot:EJW02745.1 hypothetical protein EDEG_02866 [Edhazardia aedis USNM 41457]